MGDRELRIPVGEGADLAGDLTVPDGCAGLVVFAHGSGSSRLSPRNREVAAALNERRMATLLFDLLTDREARQRANVFDVELLSRRLVAVTNWVLAQEEVAGAPVGYFGASTGAAAALCAAAELGSGISAVVSRGGRPDLAASCLPRVSAPTLLIVGSEDHPVISLNQAAAERLKCPHELALVPGATHLFEEPGTLARVTDLAAGWFAGRFA